MSRLVEEGMYLIGLGLWIVGAAIVQQGLQAISEIGRVGEFFWIVFIFLLPCVVIGKEVWRELKTEA